MTRIEKLLSIGSEALAPAPETLPEFLAEWSLGPELFAMLRQKNGFYAFESALHVFPLTADIPLPAWKHGILRRCGAASTRT